MSFFQHLRDEKNKLVVASLSSAIGFFLALLANSAIEQHRERNVYEIMLNGIRVEAAANAETLQTGFLVYYEQGIVLQQFSTSLAAQSLASTTFLKFSSNDETTKIANYMRELTLANRYRDMVEDLRKSGENEEAADHVVNSWRANLERCNSVIEAVRAQRIN